MDEIIGRIEMQETTVFRRRGVVCRNFRVEETVRVMESSIYLMQSRGKFMQE